MLRLFSRKKTTPRVPISGNDQLIADLKLQLLKTEKERDIAISRKEADEQQLDKLRRKVRELAYELQDAKDLILNERSLRESTLSVEPIAVIELNDQITICHTHIGQLRLMLKNCESKRKALGIQLSILNNKLQRSEYLRREANRRWRCAEISAIEWRKHAFDAEKMEHTIKEQIDLNSSKEIETSTTSECTASEEVEQMEHIMHINYVTNSMTTPRLTRLSIDRSSKVVMPNLPKRLFECNQQY